MSDTMDVYDERVSRAIHTASGKAWGDSFTLTAFHSALWDAMGRPLLDAVLSQEQARALLEQREDLEADGPMFRVRPTDLVGLAMRLACRVYGGESGMVFPAASFSTALRQVSGVAQTLDGQMAAAILRGRPDVRTLPGGAHYERIEVVVSLRTLTERVLGMEEALRETAVILGFTYSGPKVFERQVRRRVDEEARRVAKLETLVSDTEGSLRGCQKDVRAIEMLCGHETLEGGIAEALEGSFTPHIRAILHDAFEARADRIASRAAALGAVVPNSKEKLWDGWQALKGFILALTTAGEPEAIDKAVAEAAARIPEMHKEFLLVALMARTALSPDPWAESIEVPFGKLLDALTENFGKERLGVPEIEALVEPLPLSEEMRHRLGRFLLDIELLCAIGSGLKMVTESKPGTESYEKGMRLLNQSCPDLADDIHSRAEVERNSAAEENPWAAMKRLTAMVEGLAKNLAQGGNILNGGLGAISELQQEVEASREALKSVAEIVGVTYMGPVGFAGAVRSKLRETTKVAAEAEGFVLLRDAITSPDQGPVRGRALEQVKEHFPNDNELVGSLERLLYLDAEQVHPSIRTERDLLVRVLNARDPEMVRNYRRRYTLDHGPVSAIASAAIERYRQFLAERIGEKSQVDADFAVIRQALTGSQAPTTVEMQRLRVRRPEITKALEDTLAKLSACKGYEELDQTRDRLCGDLDGIAAVLRALERGETARTEITAFSLRGENRHPELVDLLWKTTLYYQKAGSDRTSRESELVKLRTQVEILTADSAALRRALDALTEIVHTRSPVLRAERIAALLPFLPSTAEELRQLYDRLGDDVTATPDSIETDEEAAHRARGWILNPNPSCETAQNTWDYVQKLRDRAIHMSKAVESERRLHDATNAELQAVSKLCESRGQALDLLRKPQG